MVEPTINRLGVVRYADCSAGGYLSELGMLNHSSVSSSAGVRDRDLELPFAIALRCSPEIQLAVSKYQLNAVDRTNDSSRCVILVSVVETVSRWQSASI